MLQTNHRKTILCKKNGAVCGDVRGVLREVFREAGAGRAVRGSGAGAGGGEWALLRGRARELARPGEASGVGEAGEAGAVSRAALLPTLPQHAAGRASLWVRQLADTHMPPLLLPPSRTAPVFLPENHKDQPLEPIPNMKCCANTHLPTREACIAESSQAVAVVCVPEQVEFLNFNIGKEYQVEVRVLNVSDRKVKLAVLPPARSELSVQRASRGGGAVGGDLFAGTVRRLLITFRPRSRRTFTDRLLVRDSLGHTLRVPITCYLQPPLLEVVVPGPGAGEGAGAVRCGAGDEVELGAQLLGNTHHSPLVLRCGDQHAAFFLVDEESWLAGAVPRGAEGAVGAVGAGGEGGGWAVRPRAWAGGGALRGAAWARPKGPGLFLAALRVLCSTAIARPLLLLADSLLYRSDHITVHAYEKSYDICDEGDDACEHYLNLGPSFPNRVLSSTIQITNHSPVSYSYYWMFREWGECWCARTDDVSTTVLCDHAEKEINEMMGEGLEVATESQLNDSKDNENEKEEIKNSRERVRANLKVSHEVGELRARTSTLVTISVNTALPVGAYRTVLMFVLKAIPMESIPSDCEVDVVKKRRVPLEEMPGEAGGDHEVGDVVRAQVEVWWQVCRLQHAVSPACVRLRASRGGEVPLRLRATLLAPATGAQAHWRLPPRLDMPHHEHTPLPLDPVHSVNVTLHLTLPHLPDDRSQFDVISLESDDPNGKWVSQCLVERRSYLRHPQLSAPRNWCEIVSPFDPVLHTLTLTNDTYQDILWHAEVYRWYRELGPGVVCARMGAGTCGVCYERACTCDLLEPQSGALPAEERAELQYRVHAPPDEGCVATLVLARRGPRPQPGTQAQPPVSGRASLISYRTLFTRLVLQVLPCREHDTEPCGVCVCEQGANHAPLLYVCGLTVGGTRARRIRIRSLTPLLATGRWLPPPKNDDLFEVKFIPNEFQVEGYGDTEITVEVSARGVSSRRLVCVRAASVSHARVPLYLLLVLSATGVAIDVEFPAPNVCRLQLHQKGTPLYPNRTDAQIFEYEDKRRAKLIKNICRCKQSLQYIEPTRPPYDRSQSPSEQPIPIIEEPIALTRKCACMEEGEKPTGRGGEGPPCLQIYGARVGEVTHGTLRLVSQCERTVRWRAVLRYSNPLCRKIVRVNADEELWTGESEAGLCAAVSPAKGVLQGRRRGSEAAGSCAELSVRVRGSAWGVYRDQLLIAIDALEPLVVLVYVEVAGPPLRPALAPRAPRPTPRTTCHDSVIANVWMSGSGPRGVYVTNITSCPVTVYSYLVRELETEHHVLPFRLYLRFYEELPRYYCPCMEQNGEQSETSSEKPEFRVELYLAADYGVQDDSYYKVWPDWLKLAGGARGVFHVRTTRESEPLYGDVAPEHTLLLRSEADQSTGEWWFRPRVPPAILRVKASCALPRLVAPIKTYVANVSGITITKTRILKLRKYVRLQNVGEGPIECCVRVYAPWRLVSDDGAGEEVQELPLCLCARSTTQLCAAVCLTAEELCPAEGGDAAAEGGAEGGAPLYPPRVMLRSSLEVYDTRTVLESISLVVQIELPRLLLKPDRFDFGFVCDGVTKKTYFTVSHTSRTDTLEVEVEWQGAEEFCLYPQRLTMGPGVQRQVYLQYTAKWRSSPAAGAVAVRCAGRGRGHWCRALALALACATRDHKWRLHKHDHTDTNTPTQLLPGHLVVLE